MLIYIVGIFIFILAMIFMPVIILIGKTLLAIRKGGQKNVRNYGQGTNPFSNHQRGTSEAAYDVIDTTCTVINEETL